MSASATPPPAAPPPRNCGSGGLLPGLVIILFGIGFLLENLGILHFQAGCLWPVILVAIGAVKMAQGDSPNLIWGALIAAFGAGLMLNCFHVLPFPVWRLWPVFLIALGMIWLWGASTHAWSGPWNPAEWASRRAAWHAQRRAWRAQRGAWRATFPASHPWPLGTANTSWWAAPPSASAGAAPGDPSAAASTPAGAAPSMTETGNWLYMKAVFSGLNRRVHNSELQGGWLFSFFGGCNLDLRPMGAISHTVTIDAHAIFGAVEIYVPADWTVSVHGTGLFGACEDQTRPLAASHHTGRLIVRGEAIFGGIMVKS